MDPHFEALVHIIETAFENRATLNAQNAPASLTQALHTVLHALNQGQVRVAEKIHDRWVTHAWLKQAILLSFKLFENQKGALGDMGFYDKIPLKFSTQSTTDFQTMGVRVVPPATARWGSYIAPNTVLMPSYINIGAYIDTGCMIDTWATVGSCAQIGKNVHLSGGAGIGGVLEPLQATPTIIEDDCFIGARSEVVEGVIVGQGAVIGMGVFLGQSTKIYDRTTQHLSYGYIPPYSVVVPGSLPAADGSYSLSCAVIVKQVDAQTRSKTSLNELLRSE
jgi:2,3,4,5-tetrahydropyridine-2-carboxylate N-succinyltransferase